MEAFQEYFVDFELIRASLDPEANRDQVFKAGEGAGRSGSFFFFSHDRKFIIKTMTQVELDLVLRMLPRLVKHYKKHPSSLISKMFGVFTVQTDSQSPVHLMLMENTVQLKQTKCLQYLFDLKGSLVDRKTKGTTTPSTTLKDENFRLIQQANKTELMDLDRHMKYKLLSVIKHDVDFLASEGIMDYSILLAVELRDTFGNQR